MSIEIGIMVSIIGCFVGLAGWLVSREKRVAGDAEWRGSVNAKLDVIVGMRDALTRVEEQVKDIAQRLAKTEASTQQAHQRIDEWHHMK